MKAARKDRNVNVETKNHSEANSPRRDDIESPHSECDIDIVEPLRLFSVMPAPTLELAARLPYLHLGRLEIWSEGAE
eukprot:scaffold10187_cov195-Cylindrotheca_fusiformis.AAC.4